MIIVEGPDNVGKSTLVRQLVALDPRLRVLRRDRYRPENGETIATSYFKAILPDDGDRLKHSHSIADRLIASECIYGELYRGGCRMNVSEHLLLQSVLTSYGAIVVFCRPPDDVIMQTWEDREQLYGNPMLLAHKYDERIRSVFPTLRIIDYDWTMPDNEHRIRQIIEEHSAWQGVHGTHISRWSGLPHGVGCLHRARIVVVGSFKPAGRLPFSRFDTLSKSIYNAAEATDPRLLGQLYITGIIKNGTMNGGILREELRGVMGDDEETLIITVGHEAFMFVDYLAGSIPKPMEVLNLSFVRTDSEDLYTQSLTQAFARIAP